MTARWVSLGDVTEMWHDTTVLMDISRRILNQCLVAHSCLLLFKPPPMTARAACTAASKEMEWSRWWHSRGQCASHRAPLRHVAKGSISRGRSQLQTLAQMLCLQNVSLHVWAPTLFAAQPRPPTFFCFSGPAVGTFARRLLLAHWPYLSSNISNIGCKPTSESCDRCMLYLAVRL